MKNTLLKGIAWIVFILFGGLNCAYAQSVTCEDEFNYQLLSDDNSSFSIKISNDLKENYSFKLYDISDNSKLIIEKKFESKGDNVVFSELNKGSVYLIQVVSLDGDCRFTIGGMEGIKFEN